MTVYDTTSHFLTFFDATKGKSDAEKIAHFWSDLHPANPAFYSLRLSEWEKRGENVETALLEEIKAFGAYRDEFVRLQNAVPKQLADAVASFKQTFPDFDADFEVHLLHSLESMDGGTRKLDGEHAFIFGLDMMARYHPWKNETPFFHHELLHAYTKQLHVPATQWYSSDKLLLSLWEEGLAVYVSHLLNPSAGYDELTLNFPEGLFGRVWQDRAFLASDLAASLASTDEATNRRYFTPWTNDPQVPGRAGYVVGFVVLNELAKQHPLGLLLEPPGEAELYGLVKGGLAELAALPDDAYLPGPPHIA